MITILYAYPTGAYVLCFVYGYLHGERCYYQPQAAISVYYGGRGCFVNDLYSRCGIYPFGFPQANIPAEAGNAMRVNTPQVGADQHFGCQGCLFFTTSYLL